MSDSRTVSIRWWPAAVVTALGLLAFVVTWMSETDDSQAKVLRLTAILVLTSLLLFLWLLLLSRIPWRRRLSIAGILIVCVVAFFGLFRIEGVSGNFVPILSFRFAGDADFGEAMGRAAAEASPWDSPQFFGPQRDGVVPDVGVTFDWDTAPPKEIWRRPVGEGWSGFAVVGTTAVTLEQRGTDETIAAYDVATGDALWTHTTPAVYDSVIAGNGPRSTPTIVGGRVYTYGATGILRAVALEDGSLFWQRDLHADFPGTLPEWGHAASPLVTPDGLVVVPVGGEGQLLVAVHAEDGATAWSGGSGPASYASPSLRALGGVPQILSFNLFDLSSHDPESGEVLWTVDWKVGAPNVAQPVVFSHPNGSDDVVLVSTGYGIGAGAYRPRQAEDGTWSVEEVWKNNRLKAKFTNIVLHEGPEGPRLYGLDDGILVCVDPADGQRCWKRGRYGHGQILLVGDHLVVQTEDGEIVAVAATPAEHRETGRVEALSDKSWNQSTIAGRYLLVRNHKEAVAFELPTA